ncbi:ATP-binding protein [Nitrospina watsonii]|uniref:AAA_27 domain-containing protein n=1 Tax=Nitrospina watsonii TaxID=1323948 RepID=A0ABN8VZM7_9BACT|nr:AAA family ATPase [Nitrospina watsonii]CAI2717384.1 putative AAA_27 domain-containing protein [Nitrospina watsonii]
MQLRELHIKRFGAFKDQSVAGLRPGLNLLYGENEAGKTTLLQFVRWVLFGEGAMFADHYAPEDGGKQEGSLECESVSGEAVTIQRSVQSKQKTQVRVATPSRTVENQQNLNPFLGYIPAALYKNVYAFTIEELQQLDFVKDDEVKQRIVGAGLGLGAVSLSGIRKSLNDRREALFKVRGRTQTLNALTTEIREKEAQLKTMQAELVQYDALHAEIESLMQRRDALKEPLAAANRQAQRLNTLLELFPKFVEWEGLEEALQKRDGVPDLAEAVIVEFHGLRTDWESLKKQCEEKEQTLVRLQAECDGIQVNTALLQREAEAVTLNQSSESVRNVVKELDGVQSECREKTESLQRQLMEIGPEWDEAALRTFREGEACKQHARKVQEGMTDAAQKVSTAHSTLDDYRERKARNQAEQGPVPPEFLWMAMGVAVLSVAAGIAAWVAGFMLGALFGIAGLVLAGVAAWRVRRRAPTGDAVDSLEQHYRAEVAQAESAQKQLHDAWQRWLTERGFHAALDPVDFIVLMGTVKNLQETLREIGKLKQRIERMQDELSRARERVAKLAATLPDFQVNEDVRINIELLGKQYDAHRRAHDAWEQKQASLQEHRKQFDHLEQRRQEKRQALNDLLLKIGVKDENEFLDRVEVCKQVQKLKDKIDSVRSIIESRVGRGDAFDAFIVEVKGTDPDRIQADLTEVQGRANELEKRMQEIDQKLGGCQQEQKRLANNDALFEAQSQLEMRRHRLDRAGRDWAVATLALTVLDQSLEAYQKTHQPAVYRAASEWFKVITGGAYASVDYKMETDTVDVRAASGEIKRVEHLSRGTREQLYLALRLALIQEYEKDSEPLPVLMDDVWVNFDDARRDRFVAVLAEFAKTRQVVVLSCHAASRQLCRQHGAHEVSLPTP